MGKKTLIIIWELLGNNKKERFKRFINIIMLLASIVIFGFNFRCGYNQKDGKCHDGIWAEWGSPLKKVELKKEL